jgi:hypothetical protein
MIKNNYIIPIYYPMNVKFYVFYVDNFMNKTPISQFVKQEVFDNTYSKLRLSIDNYRSLNQLLFYEWYYEK